MLKVHMFILHSIYMYQQSNSFFELPQILLKISFTLKYYIIYIFSIHG